MEKQYTIIQTAELLGITVRTVREWIRAKKITAKKYNGGRVWFISESEIDRLQKEMK